QRAETKRMTFLEVTEHETALARNSIEDSAPETAHSALSPPHFESLDAFRPLAERAPEPQVAEAQRREFFEQLHRWLRQHYAVHVFCNNDGERQRFEEIWLDYGLGEEG